MGMMKNIAVTPIEDFIEMRNSVHQKMMQVEECKGILADELKTLLQELERLNVIIDFKRSYENSEG